MVREEPQLQRLWVEGSKVAQVKELHLAKPCNLAKLKNCQITSISSDNLADRRGLI